ncbi:MAG: ATP-dependent Clp protease adaptor ClpS [Gemmataceae bacterium]
MMAIVRAVMELLRFCKTEATHKMWQAHYEGRATLIVTHKERAELFVELFALRDIVVGIEAV